VKPEASVNSVAVESTVSRSQAEIRASDAASSARHPVYLMLWYAATGLLLFSFCLAVYATGWEYSTRTYLKGFSDAIVPANAPPEEKLQAILDWIAHGPARLRGPKVVSEDRDPTDTLNYDALLRVCGTATNAFINLADSSGLSARRLLLMDANRMTKHVVAEVFINNRWAVVDPTFRVVLRGADGSALTREQLANPTVLAEATKDLRLYDPRYTYDRTAHVRLGRVAFIGWRMRPILNRILPGWEDTSIVSLILERESLAMALGAVLLVIVALLLRIGLRLYGERYLHYRTVRFRDQLRRAAHAFLGAG
jgi:hypothetical protein